MNIILHRINTIAILEETSSIYGVEIDIRSNGEDLILHHDPFQDGELFEDWIQSYHHGTLILNVKEEGLEGKILKLMHQYKISNFFFLDQSFPFLRKTSLLGEKRCSARLSEYEDIQTVFSLSGMIDWVWVDCFSYFPINKKEVLRLNKAGFKLCFVSPELQGRNDKSHIIQFRNELELLGIKGDAVCTKYADLWG